MDEKMIYCGPEFYITYWRTLYKARRIDMYDTIRHLFNCGCRGNELRL